MRDNTLAIVRVLCRENTLRQTKLIYLAVQSKCCIHELCLIEIDEHVTCYSEVIQTHKSLFLFQSGRIKIIVGHNVQMIKI